jgi:hypothetical protein
MRRLTPWLILLALILGAALGAAPAHADAFGAPKEIAKTGPKRRALRRASAELRYRAGQAKEAIAPLFRAVGAAKEAVVGSRVAKGTGEAVAATAKKIVKSKAVQAVGKGIKQVAGEIKIKVIEAKDATAGVTSKAFWRVRLAPRRTGDAKLDEALQAKFEWNKEQKLGKQGDAAVEQRLDGMAQEIGRGDVFVVNNQKRLRLRAKHRAVLREAHDVEVHAQFLEQELASFLPKETFEEVNKYLGAAMKLVKGKQLYARRGLEGIVDLMSDELIVRAIAPTPEEVAKLAVSIEAIQKAATHTLAAVHQGERPLEVQYALKKDPGLAAVLDEATRDGVSVYYRRAERTPPHVLEAINRIAVLTQENYLLNWLPGLVKEGKRPRLSVGKHGLERAREGKLIDENMGEAEILAQLEKDVATIVGGKNQMMSFVLSRTQPKHAGLSARLEKSLDDLRTDHALNRMLFDNADERTHDAQEIVKKMMFVGPIAHSLEVLHLGMAAKLFAGSADDLLGEWAEIQALKGSGFSKKEIWKRLRIAIPVFGAATYGAYKVEHLLHSGNEYGAGALFGLSAVALSLTTAIQSIGMYMKGYKELVAEGKIDGKLALAGDPKFQKTLLQLERTADFVGEAGKQRLLAEVGKHLDGLGDAMAAEDKAEILDQIRHMDLDQMTARLRKPSAWRIFRGGIKQDFSNPTRMGIVIGAGLAPVSGLAAAHFGMMNNGFVLAAVGSTESVVAGGTVLAARVINDIRQRRSLKKKLASLDEAELAVSPGP